LKTKDLGAMDLDAKTPPKTISWTFGLLTDSNADRCDCGITRASRARAVVPASRVPLSKKKKCVLYT
jgi:hypothetical protein